ncbi:MAG: hypothetical protein WDZ41_01685 [Candidatus Babeliales bacterium]
MKNKYISGAIIGIILLALFGIALWAFWRQAYRRNDLLIADHVTELAEIFNQIHETCGILSFEHQRDYIDFLNVIAFEGSEVGPMNLKYPEKWRGPYLKDNPTMQEKYYQIAQTNQGYFVVPGPGVVLNNGKVIGKDIKFDKDADIKNMIQPGGVLDFQGRPLAVQIMAGPIAEIPAGQTVDAQIIRDRLKQM